MSLYPDLIEDFSGMGIFSGGGWDAVETICEDLDYQSWNVRI